MSFLVTWLCCSGVLSVLFIITLYSAHLCVLTAVLSQKRKLLKAFGAGSEGMLAVSASRCAPGNC